MMNLISGVLLFCFLYVSTRSQVNTITDNNMLLKDLPIGIDQRKQHNDDNSKKSTKVSKYEVQYIQNLETGQFQIVPYYCKNTQEQTRNQTAEQKQIKTPVKAATVYNIPRPGKQRYFYKPHNYKQISAILTIVFIKGFFENGPGIQFKIVPKYNQTSFQAVFTQSQTMRWTTIRVNYLINSRDDLFCGNYETSSKKGLQEKQIYLKYNIGYQFKKEQIKLRSEGKEIREPNITSLISGLKSADLNFSVYATQQNKQTISKSNVFISAQFNLLNKNLISRILVSFIIYLPNSILTVKTIPVGVEFHRYSIMKQTYFRRKAVANLSQNDGNQFQKSNIGFQDKCQKNFLNQSNLQSSIPSNFQYYQLSGMISYNGTQLLQSLNKKRNQGIQQIQSDSTTQDQIQYFTSIFQIQQIRFVLRPWLKVYSQRPFSSHDPFIQKLMLKNQPISFKDCVKYNGIINQDRKQNPLCAFCNVNQVFNQKCQKCQCKGNFTNFKGRCRSTREICKRGVDMVYTNGQCFRSVHVQTVCLARFRKYNNITKRCQGCIQGFIQPTLNSSNPNKKTQCIPSCPEFSYMDPYSLRCICGQTYYMINNTCMKIICGAQYRWNFRRQRCQCKEQTLRDQISGDCVKCSPYERIQEKQQESKGSQLVRRFCVKIEQPVIVNRSTNKSQQKKN